MGVLYITATPIGNLGDITLRALETLKSVSVIACEDTRRTRKLLTHFGLQAKLISVRAANEKKAAAEIISALAVGDAAYTSDAGTPALSDPGAALARAALDAGYKVAPIPGVSAFACLISAAGAKDKTIVFEGFLSPKPARRKKRVAELMKCGAAFVVYESPFRIVNFLQDVADFDSVRYVCVGREMTKFHEEFVRGAARDVAAAVEAGERRGEFAVYVSAFSA